MKFFAFVFYFYICMNLFSQEMIKIISNDDRLYEGFEIINYNENEIKINYNGVIEYNSTIIPHGNRDYYFIESAFYCNIQNNVVITLQYTSGGYGYSEIVIINEKENWSYIIIGFNLSNGLIIENYLIITTISKIIKFDIVKKNICWEINDLYEKYRFNHSDKIIHNDDSIIVLYNFYKGIFFIDFETGNINKIYMLNN